MESFDNFVIQNLINFQALVWVEDDDLLEEVNEGEREILEEVGGLGTG